MFQVTATDPRPPAAPAVFPSVLVGVDGSVASLEGVRHAAAISPGARIRLLAVAAEQGVPSRSQAEQGLFRAARILADAGVRPALELVEDPEPALRLLREAQAHDLLVLGMDARSRALALLSGSPGSSALHRAAGPVLVARPLAADRHLLGRIVLAVDGTEPSLGAARTAAALLRGHAGAHVSLVAPVPGDATEQRILARCASEIGLAVGEEPEVLAGHGPVQRAILRAAAREEATLVVVGSRGLARAAALRSVSERVAFGAHCSVLVVRGRVVWP